MRKSIGTAMTRAWASLRTGHRGEREWRALRVETTHPLDVFAAIREQDGVLGLLFECPLTSAPPWRLRFDSEGLQLFDDRAGRDGSRQIVLALELAELQSVFLVMAEDLITCSADTGDVKSAIEALGTRLAAWQTCLRLRRDGFGQERILGLYGELVVLEQLASAIGLNRAIAAWSGPDRGLHDFESNMAAIEVKTSLGQRGHVQIGSLDQLDPSRLRVLVLCRVAIVPDDAGVELSELIARARKMADNAGRSVRLALDQRLLMSGYIDPDARNSSFERFTVVALEAYEVREDFPRLTRETVGAAVVSAKYRLDLGAAVEYQMTADSLAQLLTVFDTGRGNGE